ncbi:MAG: HAD hydrolase family protein [Verrucomicrobiota bacterium]
MADDFMPDNAPNAILCFDFDGTLVDNPSDPYEIAQLEQFLTHMGKRGAIWGINTGRTLFHTLDGLKQHGFRLTPDFIVARECEIYHLNEYHRWVDLGDWNKRCANDHRKFYKTHGSFFKRLQKHMNAELPGARFISDSTEPAGLVANDEDIMAAVCGWIDTQLTDWPMLGYQRNSIWLRFTHQGYHKGSALQEIRRLLDIGPEFTFAAGDNYNDLSMLRHEVAHGLACPANAVPDVTRHVESLGGFVAGEESTLGMVDAIQHFFYQE